MGIMQWAWVKGCGELINEQTNKTLMAELHYSQYFVISVYVLLGDNPDPALLNPCKKTKIQALRAK